MAEAFEVQIADAVTAELNGVHGWVKPFNAVRRWESIYKIEELQELQVAVGPTTIETVTLERGGRSNYSYGIAIEMQKMVNPNDTPEMDGLSKVAEQIHEFFGDSHALTGMPTYRVRSSERPLAYFWDPLYEHLVWTTMIDLVVTGAR